MRACVLLLVACGSSSTKPMPDARLVTSTDPLPSPPAGKDDEVVATIDGTPIFGSCVAAQVARNHALDRRAALDECIAFELLARDAAKRGFASDPDVVEAGRQAMVSTVVARQFEDRFARPEDARAMIDSVIARTPDQMDRPELRASTFVRVDAPIKTTSVDQEAKAKALADKIYAALANETGLYPSHVIEIGERIGKGSGQKLTHGDFRAATREGVVTAYGDALYSIPEVGRVAPPARTEWGYDIVLWSGGFPPQKLTWEQAAAQIFPELRRALFVKWSRDMIKTTGAHVEIHPELIPEDPE